MEKDFKIDIFVEGKPVTFGGSQPEQIWKQDISKVIHDMEWEHDPSEVCPYGESKVILDFALTTERFMGTRENRKNDLDNLAKPVLDVLCSKIGPLVDCPIIEDDSMILELILSKRISSKEGVRISIIPYDHDDLGVHDCECGFYSSDQAEWTAHINVSCPAKEEISDPRTYSDDEHLDDERLDDEHSDDEHSDDEHSDD